MKKHIITLAGGIGNQMLQYGLFLYLQSQNYKCVLYKKPEHLNDNHGFDIDFIFNSITLDKKNRIEINLYIQFIQYFTKIERYITKLFYLQNRNLFIKLLPVQIVNFPTWDNYTFYNNMDDVLHQVYKFPDFVSEKNIKTSCLIESSNSVSIHIRRGDYIKNVHWRSILGDICDLDYYAASIKIIHEVVDNPYFFIFSDDIDWVKENLIINNCFFVDWNTGNESYMDMQLMALCKHNIIANSTFSLMGAWLNKNPHKIVIGPSKWRNYYQDKTADKFMNEGWKIINIDKPNVSLLCQFELSENDLINIVNQTYSDFEVLFINHNEDLKKDERFKNISHHSPKGNHIFKIKEETIKNFSDRKYVEKLLLENYA